MTYIGSVKDADAMSDADLEPDAEKDPVAWMAWVRGRIPAPESLLMEAADPDDSDAEGYEEREGYAGRDKRVEQERIQGFSGDERCNLCHGEGIVQCNPMDVCPCPAGNRWRKTLGGAELTWVETPEGVEDFAAKWFGAIDLVVPVSDDQKAQACADAFQAFAEKMAATSAPPAPPAMAEAAAKIEAHLAMNAAQQQSGSGYDFANQPTQQTATALSHLIVPRSAPTADARRIAALEAELAAARAALTAAATQARELTGQATKAAPAPLAGALRAWSGYGGIDQLTGKPSWV